MNASSVQENIAQITNQFASERSERQSRRYLDKADFTLIHEAGFTRWALPPESDGLWRGVAKSARPICSCLRTLAKGDSSVALVSAMHPAVLSYWLTATPSDKSVSQWTQQMAQITESVSRGDWWGTATSEPGSGGDVGQTRSIATKSQQPNEYRLSGRKHFCSGSGISKFMVTTALPDGEQVPDWFFVNLRDLPWDGSAGVRLLAEWDGHGMIATQSHSFELQKVQATRIAWPEHLTDIATHTGAFIGCLFTAVVVGIAEVALQTTLEQLTRRSLGSYEQVELTRAEQDYWLIEQAYQGMLRAVESGQDARTDVLRGKTAIAELVETLLMRLCRISGGSTFSRRSALGNWFEDVRALGYLRPPWSLAMKTLTDLRLNPTE